MSVVNQLRLPRIDLDPSLRGWWWCWYGAPLQPGMLSLAGYRLRRAAGLAMGRSRVAMRSSHDQGYTHWRDRGIARASDAAVTRLSPTPAAVGTLSVLIDTDGPCLARREARRIVHPDRRIRPLLSPSSGFRRCGREWR